MLRRPKHSAIEVVAPKEEEEVTYNMFFLPQIRNVLFLKFAHFTH
jgi:hypothetical protein